jgi:hypothetical protein
MQAERQRQRTGAEVLMSRLLNARSAFVDVTAAQDTARVEAAPLGAI